MTGYGQTTSHLLTERPATSNHEETELAWGRLLVALGQPPTEHQVTYAARAPRVRLAGRHWLGGKGLWND